MALGTITVVADAAKSASAPLGAASLSFAGDDAYTAGGTVDFQASVRAILGRDVTLLCVIPLGLNGGYDVIYDKANDTLLTVVKSTGVETAPGVDLQGTTFLLMALYE